VASPWTAPAKPTDFAEALLWFLTRVPMTPEAFYEMASGWRREAFSLSGAASVEMVKSVMVDVVDTMKDGTSLRGFRARALAKLEAEWAGTVANPGFRAETIYRNAVQTAYNDGRRELMTEPDVLIARPFWQFDAILDEATTDICKRRDGIVYPANDPWWARNTPPLHHRCRSSIRTMSRAEASKKGVTMNPNAVGDLDPQAGFGLARETYGPDWSALALQDAPPQLRAAFAAKWGAPVEQVNATAYSVMERVWGSAAGQKVPLPGPVAPPPPVAAPPAPPPPAPPQPAPPPPPPPAPAPAAAPKPKRPRKPRTPKAPKMDMARPFQPLSEWDASKTFREAHSSRRVSARQAKGSGQFQALKDYTGGDYGPMNRYLRQGRPDGTYQYVVEKVDKATALIGKFDLPADVVLRRSYGAPRSIFPADIDDYVGTVVQDKGFMSTTVRDGHLSFGGSSEVRVLLEIEARAGHPGVYAEAWSNYSSEMEFILPPGSRFRVLSAKMEGSTMRLRGELLPYEP